MFWTRLHLILLTTAIIITLTLNLYALNDYYVHVVVVPIYGAQFSHGVCRMLNTYIWWCIFVLSAVLRNEPSDVEWARVRESVAKMAKDKMKRENPKERKRKMEWETLSLKHSLSHSVSLTRQKAADKGMKFECQMRKNAWKRNGNEHILCQFGKRKRCWYIVKTSFRLIW